MRIHIFTEKQLKNCLDSGVDVEVMSQNEVIEVGKIKRFSENAIIINSNYYLRKNCCFYALNNYFKLVTIK